MHDIRAIRENPAAFDAALSRRGDAPLSSELRGLDEARRASIQAAETAQADANKAAKEVGAAKGRGDEAEFQRLRALVAEKKAEIAALNDQAKAQDAALTARLAEIPNLPADDVPDGADEADNVEVNRWGTPRDIPNALEHFDIPAVKPGMDFETAAKLIEQGQSMLGHTRQIFFVSIGGFDNHDHLIDSTQRQNRIHGNRQRDRCGNFP
jgi:seryl-tRNA synthetase